MITLLHGDFIEASRNEFFRLKKEAVGQEVRVVEGKSIEEPELTQAVESSSLFGGNTYVFIEHLFGKLGKQPKKAEGFCHILLRGAETTNIVLWEDRETAPSIVKHLGNKTTVRLFKLPAMIFQFLDSFTPKAKKQLIIQFQKLAAEVSAEVIFAMLVKRVRQLIQLSDRQAPAGLAPWQIQRLTTQASSFTMEQLIHIEKQLLDIEVSIKSGSSAFSLTSHIEYLLANL